VPWCLACDRFLSPSTVRADGTCPSCGRLVDPGRARAAASEPASTTVAPAVEDAPAPVPWHLKLLLVALAIYLAYRAFQGVDWVVSHL
jgi:hypothetical protein